LRLLIKVDDMKYFALNILLVLCFVPLRAQDNAGAILDKVSSTMQSYSTVQADFSFTLENKEADIFDSYEGSLVMEGEKYRLSLMSMLIFCDAKTMWIYNEDFNEANIMDPSDSEFFNPKNIFSIYKEDFNLRLLNKDNGLNEIELTPIEENDNYKLLIIKSDQKNNQIKEVFYEGLDGNNYIVKIKNMMTDIQVDDRFFTFDKAKYPGVEVYDMR